MILVTGVTGQLGSLCAKILGGRALAPTEAELDLTDSAAVGAFFAEHKNIEGVIHCAAYTAVDKAEDDCLKCEAVNTLATKILAEAAAASFAKMLYVSTDYVFDGTKTTPYEADDKTNPQSVYGKTKLAGEEAVKNASERFFIVRTQWLYGDGNNFVKTMLRLFSEKDEINVVSDQRGCPTAAADLAALLCEMIDTDRYGVYNASGEGECSWYEFASEILHIKGGHCRINPVSSREFPLRAPRPKYSVLSKKSLTDNGFKLLPYWKDSLVKYLS
jgi:dTDP-4-dehydrorhamnose reductase